MLLAAVFVNIGVWFIEQLVSIEFEMLSVSYIISVLFLIALDSLIKESEKAEIAEAIEREEVLKEKAENFNSEELLKSVSLLTITERLIFDYYIEGKSTKEIMAMLNIKENTLKFHNKNIYSKLSVSSRKELVEIYKKLG
ncbi:MAG: helix-turn-helix transcriptional regulator [Clostridia bacterium]|nr:helix-turn-helix transcriptional regulator [Clostridia bacterium]